MYYLRLLWQQNTKYSGREGYLFCESSKSIEVKDEDLVLSLEPVSMYRLHYDPSMDIRCDGYRDWDEYDREENCFICVVPGDEVTVAPFDMDISDKYTIQVYRTGNSSQKVREDCLLTKKNPSCTFVMPAYDVTVQSEAGKQKASALTIQEHDFSNTSAIVVKKYNDTERTESVKSGDEIYEGQTVRVYADSIENNRKMVATFRKTGTEEYVTGSSKGVLIDRIKSALFEMIDVPVTIDITETERKGNGNPRVGNG